MKEIYLVHNTHFVVKLVVWQLNLVDDQNQE